MQKQQKDYLDRLYNDIEQAGSVLQKQAMPDLTEEAFFLFQKTGNRLVYEHAYFGRRKYLTVYAILALWGDTFSGQGQSYVADLEQTIYSICDEKFWALPAHVDFDRIDEPDTICTIDLFAAETAQALSEIAVRLGDRLSRTLTDRVVEEVCRRVLVPFVNSTMPYSWWETDRCNWSAVCAGSIGMAAVYVDMLLNTGKGIHTRYADQLSKGWEEACMQRVCASMQCYLDGMEEDGACTEGLGYYSYGMSFYTAFAELCGEIVSVGEQDGHHSGQMYHAIQKYWQEKFCKTDSISKKLEKIALFQQKCYFGGGVSISFSDGSQKEPFLPGLTAYLKKCYPQVCIPDFRLARPFDADACYRYLTNERNIRWLLKYGMSYLDTAKSSVQSCGITDYLLPSAQWMICQDQEGNGFAAKGGHNDENHNHNDIGHFLCVYHGEMFLTDLGAGEYTKDYFGGKRYEILCNRSIGHSVPIINGEEQCAGRQYHADCFQWDEIRHTLTIGFAGAYREGLCAEIVRRIRMHTKQEQMQIEVADRFTWSEEPCRIEENLITTFLPAVQEGMIVLTGERAKCCIVPENCTAIEVIPCNHSCHDGSLQTVYRIRWDLEQKNCQKTECKMWITCTKI